MTTPKSHVPKAWEAIAARLGIDQVDFEGFLRWAHGKSWGACRPSDLADVAKRYGIRAKDKPINTLLLDLYLIYKSEVRSGQTSDRSAERSSGPDRSAD